MITKEDKSIIQNNLNLTLKQLVSLFDEKYSPKQIKNFCNNNHLNYKKETKEAIKIIRKNAKKKQREQTPINHCYFQTWSANMAYILGLWFADGCIYTNKNNGYYFSIKLHKNDDWLLQNILDEMQSQHKIYYNTDDSAHITFSSKTIYNDIIKLGGVNNKSLVLQFPKIPNEYMKDFIRGYFDGDGSVSYDKNRKCYRRYVCSGSFEFVNYLYSYLKENQIIKGSGVYNSKGCSIPRLIFNKTDGISFEQYMMKDSPTLYLNRKHNNEINLTRFDILEKNTLSRVE